jgi:hypothetical protein
MPAMSTKSRDVIYGGRIIGARLRNERAKPPGRPSADRAEAEEER